MIYLEGYVSLQKGYMGRYEDVYDIYEGHMARQKGTYVLLGGYMALQELLDSARVFMT